MNAHDASLHREAPNNIPVEQALIGSILNSQGVYDRVSSFLEPQHFYEPLHRKMFEVAADLIRAGKKVDPILILPFLPAKDKINDITVQQYVMRLAANAVSNTNVRDWGLAIHDMWIRRQAISTGQALTDLAYDLPPEADPLAQFEPFEAKLATLRAERVRNESRKGNGQLYLEEMEAAKQRRDIRGVPICLEEIKTVLSEPCFEAGNLYGLLSSSSEGKTSLMLQIALHALQHGHPVQIQSYDQSGKQFVRQMVAQQFDIEARRQRFGDLGDKEWKSASDFARWIDAQPFEVVKCTTQGAAQLVGQARTFQKRHVRDKEALYIVDHIGSVEPEDRRADEGTKAKGINKIFKAGAEMTDAPWLILNQRSSFGMKRDNPRPILSDIYGGEAAKQAYDSILYLYRFKKFYEERKAIASSDADWKKINKVFPEDVRTGAKDIAELGGLKIRFGNPNITDTVDFVARYTRYVSNRQPVDQEVMEALL